jgi:hypothetical protein
MEDKRKNNGGHKTAGRKSKSEEQKLAEKLKPFEPFALAALEKAIKDGKDWAIKLYFQYNYGMPNQKIEQKTEHSLNGFDIKEIFQIDKD